MRGSKFTVLARAGLFGCLVGACLPTSGNRLQRQTDDDAGSLPPVLTDAGSGVGDAPSVSPHAVLGVDPPHGPFSGGTLVAIRGNGFGSNARVWFGTTELDPTLVLGIDPQRLQVTSPGGEPGPSDVIVQNGDDETTRVRLAGGFTYDEFYLEPSSGPTSGGSIVSVYAHDALFDDETSIEIDQSLCAVEEVVSPRELKCRTAPGTPGAKRVRARLAGGTELDVLDAFTYVVSGDGFRGGLGGDPLDGSLEVLVLDDLSGLAIRGATVIVGDDAASALQATTDSFGTAVVTGSDVVGSATVTIAKECYQPITFVNVPVERVTAYLLPVLSPACGSGGEIPGGGGVPGRGTSISGELIWGLGGEFRRVGFSNVPAPSGPDEHQVAYVFRLASQPTAAFSLPSGSAITPTSTGEVGYSFYFSTSPGNFSLYALAGLEDRSRTPYRFTPYALGLTRGVVGSAGQSRDGVFIEIDVPLDHRLSIDATGPATTDRGPDRIESTLAIEVGGEGYILLPNGNQSSLLPRAEPFHFVGVPPLWGSLTGARYVATARASTGTTGTLPLSAVGLFATTTEGTIGVGAFVEIPRLVSPESGATWNGNELRLESAPGGAAPDLTIIDVASGNDLVNWRIVAPGLPSRVRVPDLAVIGANLGLVRGPLVIQVTAARADEFSYSTVRYRQLAPRGWRAFAQDAFFGNY